MADRPTTFVFIDEDQQKKYSKSTLSAINAQVAKYAHKQRQTIPKSHSAPSSPPETGLVHAQEIGTQDDGPKQGARRKSDSKFIAVRRKSLESKALQPRRDDRPTKAKPLKKVESPRRNSAGEVPAGEAIIDNPSAVETQPESLTDLFENLCRITKHPSYQAFPFFLNLEERRLAHYWFTEILPEDFGSSKLRLDDTFQCSITKYPLAFQVPLRWIIAHAAHRLYKKTGSQSLAVVYRSQQHALQSLQSVLLDHSTPTDEAIGSVQYSIVHNPEYRKIHLRGLDAMIQDRGGMECVMDQCAITQADHLFLMYTFADFDITRSEELDQLKSQFLGALLAIQESSAEYFQMKSQMEVWASSVDLAECSDFGASNMQKWSYTELRSRVFGPDTTMGRLIRQPFERNASTVNKSRLFGALFQLATMLREYETTEEKAIFLRQLEKSANIVCETSVDPLTGQPMIMPGASIFTVGHVSRQIHDDFGPANAPAKGMTAAITGIAALKIYFLLLDSMRERLHTFLQSWLLGHGNVCLRAGDISALSAVITQLWLQQRRSISPQPELQHYCNDGNTFQSPDTSKDFFPTYITQPTEQDDLYVTDEYVPYTGVVNT